MFIFYVDESGSPTGHKEPLLDGQTPLFVIASLAFKADVWRDLDRAYRDLKVKFFSSEIGNRRPEQYEVKGSDLIRPGNKTSRRRLTFMRRALELCLKFDGQGFAVIFRKNPVKPTPKNSQYNMGLQYGVERFDHFLDEIAGGLNPRFKPYDAQGIIVADSRMKNLDMNVAISHLSFIFGNPLGQQCQRIIEAPTFTFSELSVGVQLADIFAVSIYSQFYRKVCTGITGSLDYSHLAFVDDYLRDLQWQAQRAYNGYFMRGYRYLDHSVPP
jgi:hypothetical protein